MSKINDLIQELCPNGVEYKKLKEIGDTFTGLSGKSKDDFYNGNCRYITYTNIFNNPVVRLDLDDTTEEKIERYKSGKMFEKHWLSPYIIPIWNDINLDHVLYDLKLISKIPNDKRKRKNI